MSRKVEERLIRKHVWMSEEDWNWIEESYGNTLGTSKAVRLMIKNFRKAVKDKALAGAKSISTGATAIVGGLDGE